jgi:DNA polymerase I-like protein with 3'-5' exonuclease and polymerase domains
MVNSVPLVTDRIKVILSKVRETGGTFGFEDGRPFVRGDAGALSENDIAFLNQAKPDLIQILTAPSDGDTGIINDDQESRTFGVVDGSHPYEWTGQQLGHEIGIDCETLVIEGRSIPKLVLVSVSDGSSYFVLRPEQLPEFLCQHETSDFVAHNSAFDFWVIWQALGDRGPWWSIADSGRLHDTMLLDALIRLGKSDEFPKSRDLGTVASEYAGIQLDKTDPYRTRFGELIGADWSQIDRGFFDYAIADAHATVLSYRRMKEVAGSMNPCSYRFGLLTESLQARAAIVLDQIARNGMVLDLKMLSELQDRYRMEIASLTQRLMIQPCAGALFKRNHDGSLKFTKKSQKPQISMTHLESVLDGIANKNSLVPPRTAKTGKTTTSINWWAQHELLDPFLTDWIALEKASKLYQFFSGMKEKRIHPRYQTLVRTGRTSCSGPNIQQLPRDGGFREVVIASPGTVLLIADYSAIELRTLAAVCETRYRSSKLADVLRDGIDPHAYTAAMFAGQSLAEFDQMAKPDRKQLRQRAKALNFGIPGGLGVRSLVEYARQTYGVELAAEEAEQFRDRLISDVYPELSHYLAEDNREVLAWNLRANETVVKEYLTESMAGASRRIVRGETTRRTGEPYSQDFLDRVWMVLKDLNRNPDLDQLLMSRRAGDEAEQHLFWAPAETLTGRIRGSVSYSQARNTPFQGLAADGAKLALWMLLRAGYRITAFVHDEVVIELPVSLDYASEARSVERILCDAMTDTLQSDIPVTVEYSVARRWYKQAEAVWKDGRLVPWEPGPNSQYHLPGLIKGGQLPSMKISTEPADPLLHVKRPDTTLPSGGQPDVR